MKKHLLTKTFLFLAFLIWANVGWGQNIWTGTAGDGLWTSATNWSTGVPIATDIVQFNSNATVTAVPAAVSIYQLVLTNNAQVSLAASAASVITLTGAAGVDLDVPAGCSLTIGGTFAISLTMSTGTTGSVSGNIITTGGAAHRILPTDASALTFNNGSTLTQDNSTGNIFSNAGTANVVVFASGSTFIQKIGSNPFGLTQPATRVVFQTGSLFQVASSSVTPALSGRTYANLEINASAFSATMTGGSVLTVDNLTITSATNAYFNLTGGINIKGNLSVVSGIVFFSPATAGTTFFNGSAPQSISVGASGSLYFGSLSTIQLAQNLNITGLVKITGVLDATDKVISGTGTLSMTSVALNTTGDLTTGTKNITNVPTIAGVFPGMAITGTGIAASTYITSITGTGPYTIVISANATATNVGTAISITCPAPTIKTASTYGLDATNNFTVATPSFDAGSTYIYNGTAAQVTGALLLASVKNVTLDNTADITLSSNLTVTGNLTFTNGKLDIGNKNITVNTIIGASSSKYIVTSLGGLVKMNTNASGSVTYPIGPSVTSYTPFISTNNSTNDVLSISVDDAISNSSLNDSRCVNLQWVGTDALTSSDNDGTITFQWNSSDHGSSFNPSEPVYLGIWDVVNIKYIPNLVTVSGSNPYTVTMNAPATYPVHPVIFGNGEAFLIASPTLTADATSNNVDNNIEITFTDDATWRAAITEVNIGGTALTVNTDYTIAAGIITLIPSGLNALLTTSGDKTVNIIATDYIDATVIQTIEPGAVTATNSTMNTVTLGLGTTSSVTLTAKDQYDNIVPVYVFKYDATVTDVDVTTNEDYTIAGISTTSTVSSVSLDPTVAGVITFDIIVPVTVDPADGISIQFLLTDGATTFKSAIEYFKPVGPNISANTSPALTELNLDGAIINLIVSEETLANASPVNITNFTLNNAPSGVSIFSVTFESTTTATVTLAYDGTDFDSDISDFSVSVAGIELTLGNPLTSSKLAITAVVETKPVVTTNAAITTNGLTTATWGGNVSSTGGEDLIAKGICWSTSANPTEDLVTKTDEGTALGSITGSMTGLTSNTLYHVRAYATNSLGTNYGADQTFTTYAPAPVFTATYPKTTLITLTGFTVAVNTNAIGKVYFLRQASGTAAPTSATVKSTGTAINIIAASTEYTSAVTGLVMGTTYDVYFVTENSDANVLMGTPIMISVTTLSISEVTIHDIQYTTATPADSPYKTQQIKTSGIVTGTSTNGFFIQDGNGEWNGVYVYNNTVTRTVGDLVEFVAIVDEYYNLTELKTVTSYNVLSQGNTAPVPASISIANAGSEAYEGVLVSITNAECTVLPDSHGEWTVSDGTNTIIVDDVLFAFTPVLGTKYNITGIIDYTFSAFKLYPRNASDITEASGTGIINHSEFVTLNIYPNPSNGQFTLELNAQKAGTFNVEIVNISGQVVFEKQIVQDGLYKEYIDINNRAKGMYYIRINDGTSVKVQKIVIQ